jgi:hypothetical protein
MTLGSKYLHNKRLEQIGSAARPRPLSRGVRSDRT